MPRISDDGDRTSNPQDVADAIVAHISVLGQLCGISHGFVTRLAV